MVYFVRFFAKVHCIIIGVLLITPIIDGVKGNLPEVDTVIDFLQNVIRPYVDRLRSSGAHVFRASLDSRIENVIDKKIKELKPILQDFDESNEHKTSDDRHLMQEGNEETSILEFVPNIKDGKKNALRNLPPLKDSKTFAIKKLKKDKKKIEKALQKELVSNKTQRMVTKILDKLITQLIENQCTWKSTSERALMRGSHNSDGAIVVKKWHEEWTKLKNRYASYTNSETSEPSEGLKVFQFFDQFHDFITHIAEDAENLSDRYKIICQVKGRKNKDTSVQLSRDNNNNSSHSQERSSLDNFKVCSTELKNFLSELYTLLNNTAISTFKNYAAMYIRDVNTASWDEKEHVVDVIHKMSNITERKVTKTFTKETRNFELDNNKDKSNNMKHIKTYVKRTIEFVKEHMRNTLKTGLVQFKTALRTSIEKDLVVNIDQDTVNLEKDVRKRIGKTFTTCNGKMNGRRNDLILDTNNLNENSIYVKLQLELDDDLKHSLTNSNVLESLRTESKRNSKNIFDVLTTRYIKADVQRKYINFNVTRTTYNDAYKSTTNSSKYLSGIIIEVFNSTKRYDE